MHLQFDALALVDSTFDIRLLQVSDSTIHIGVARGGGGGVG